MAHLKGSLRSRTEYLRMPKMMAEKPAAMAGAIPHEAAIWETLPLVHSQWIGA
jgi:hypothetical protein